MSDSSKENPYESPVVTSQFADRNAVRLDWKVRLELLGGAIALLAISAPFYFGSGIVGGGVASGLALAVAIRTWISVRRRTAADCFQSGDVWESFGVSIFIVMLTAGGSAVVVFAALLTVCTATAANQMSLDLQLTLSLFGGGFGWLATMLAILYFLGPATVDKLRQSRDALNSPRESDQGSKPSDRS